MFIYFNVTSLQKPYFHFAGHRGCAKHHFGKSGKSCRFIFGVFLVIMYKMFVAAMWIFVVVVCRLKLAISQTAPCVFVTSTLI